MSNLRATVNVGRTVSLKRYNVIRVEWSEEHYQDEKTMEDAATDLLKRLDAWLDKVGVRVVGP